MKNRFFSFFSIFSALVVLLSYTSAEHAAAAEENAHDKSNTPVFRRSVDQPKRTFQGYVVNGEEISAGTSFSTAARVEEGEYKGDILGGETKYYKVYAGNGETVIASCTAILPEAEAKKPRTDISRLIKLHVYDQYRQEIGFASMAPMDTAPMVVKAQGYLQEGGWVYLAIFRQVQKETDTEIPVVYELSVFTKGDKRSRVKAEADGR